jgi:hypothetical protein
MIFPAALHARVGETQEMLEKRLLQPGVGKLYPRPTEPKEKDKDKDKDKKTAKEREAERQQRKEAQDDPLKDVRPFLPAETHEMFYWKSAVANQLSNDTGWKVDVLYIGGRSALEIYKRVGDSLSSFEVKGILNINRGNSSWKKVTNEGGGTNGIGYNFELEDGSLRASQQDGWIMVFSVKLDNYVMQQQLAAKAENDRQLDQQKREQALKAPESVSGF